MPKLTSSTIVSDTKWIKLVATRIAVASTHARESVNENWYLTIYVSGVELEFRAVEGPKTCLFTQQEALRRVQEFEKQVYAEGKDLIQEAVGKALDSFLRGKMPQELLGL